VGSEEVHRDIRSVRSFVRSLILRLGSRSNNLHHSLHKSILRVSLLNLFLVGESVVESIDFRVGEGKRSRYFISPDDRLGSCDWLLVEESEDVRL